MIHKLLELTNRKSTLEADKLVRYHKYLRQHTSSQFINKTAVGGFQTIYPQSNQLLYVIKINKQIFLNTRKSFFYVYQFHFCFQDENKILIVITVKWIRKIYNLMFLSLVQVLRILLKPNFISRIVLRQQFNYIL